MSVLQQGQQVAEAGPRPQEGGGGAVQQEARPAVLASECVACVRSKEPRTQSRVGGESGRGEVRSRRLEGPVGPSRAWQAGRGLSSPHAGPAVLVT